MKAAFRFHPHGVAVQTRSDDGRTAWLDPFRLTTGYACEAKHHGESDLRSETERKDQREVVGAGGTALDCGMRAQVCVVGRTVSGGR